MTTKPAVVGNAVERGDVSFDSTANWASVNPVLLKNEQATDTTTGDVRVGDGSTPYLTLSSLASDWTNGLPGAVVRTLKARLGDAVSVKDFGVKGDGSDDTAAFTAAIASGRSLTVPDGTYIVNSLTLNQAGQALLLSKGATLKTKTAGSQTVLIVTANNVSVIGNRGATIDGNNVGNSAGSTIYVNAATGVTISGLNLVNCAGLGINGQGDGVAVLDNVITNAGSAAVFISPPTTSANITARVEGNTITNGTAGPYGIQVHGRSPSSVVRLKVRGNDVILPAVANQGICIEVYGGCPKAIVSNNTLIGGSMGVSVSGSDGVVVVGNAITGPADYGIEMAGSNRVTVSGNTVDGNAVTGYGIIVSNTPNVGNTISGNVVYNYNATTGNGISIQGTASETAIVGNSVTGRGPVVLLNGSKVTVTGNILDGNGVAVAGVEMNTCSDIIAANNLVNNCTLAGVNAYNGTMQRIIVGPNVLAGGTPADLYNGPLGAGSRIIRGTLAPTGVSAITVTASPFTYTAGNRPEAVYVTGGTVSAITKNGVAIFGASPATVQLEPGEAVTVTYIATPTMNKDVK